MGTNSNLLKVPEYLPVIKKAIRSETRKALAIARDSRCLENGETLAQLIDLKHEAAQLMGYETHAHYQLEVILFGNIVLPLVTVNI